jgi:L-rhamnose isomerase/sugar isomerase
MAEFRIAQDLVATDNDKRATALKADYEALGATLARRGVDIEAVTRKVAEFFVAVSPAPASRAASSTSSTIAPSSTN